MMAMVMTMIMHNTDIECDGEADGDDVIHDAGDDNGER